MRIALSPQSFRVKVQSDWIRAIPISVSKLFWIISKQSQKSFEPHSMQIDRCKSTHSNWNFFSDEPKFGLFGLNQIESDWFSSKEIENESDWIWLIFIEGDWKRFSDSFEMFPNNLENYFRMTRIRSDWIPSQNFRQDCTVLFSFKYRFQSCRWYLTILYFSFRADKYFPNFLIIIGSL